MKKYLLLFLFVFINFTSYSQILEPAHWKNSVKDLGNGEFELTFDVTLDEGWHIFSSKYEGISIPTTITVEENKDIKLIGTVIEKGKLISKDEEVGNEVDHLKYFEGKATFIQKIKLLTSTATVSGYVNFMTCKEVCLPPSDNEFKFSLSFKNADPVIAPVKTDTVKVENKDTLIENSVIPTDTIKKESNPVISTPESDLEDQSIWQLLLAGFSAGLLSLLTPCVYSMLPLTVTFFTKRSGTRKKGLINASFYGFSIVLIFVLIGLVLALFHIDDSALNELASNGYFNFILFILFMIFAISFFGVFEITLPTSWINKSEELSDKGGYSGIFFMALTLVLVSFSCTIPFIGAAIRAMSGGSFMNPIIGMFAYSVTLAFPFVLFAFFPNWLQSLPKSGGWLNMVKVSFAFIELALALKFLSNVDLAYHWRLLDREVFLCIWIIIFLLLGFYLLGFIRFSHDSETTFLSIPRLFLAMAVLSFTMYMIPGLWGAPLKAISAFAPPAANQDFDLTRNSFSHPPSATSLPIDRKYAEFLHCPNGLECYFDYEEGLAAAKKLGKPIFIDFTGHTCINCRKMEATVWSDPNVLKHMTEDYIVISLYVDDRTELPLAEQYISKLSGKKINTVGKKNTDLQSSRYNINAQPYYVLINHKEELLSKPRAYDQDIPAYVKFLENGLTAFKMSK